MHYIDTYSRSSQIWQHSGDIFITLSKFYVGLNLGTVMLQLYLLLLGQHSFYKKWFLGADSIYSILFSQVDLINDLSNEDERHPLRRKMIDLLVQNHVTKIWLIIVNRDNFIHYLYNSKIT